MRLRFPDKAIRRLYEAGHPLPTMEPESVHRFFEVVAGPLVRSSYRAEQALAQNNAGLDAGR